MTFDFNEARAIIEEAKQRGMIRAANTEPTAETPATSQKPVIPSADNAVIPDWLQEGIRLGPLVRSEDDRERR